MAEIVIVRALAGHPRCWGYRPSVNDGLTVLWTGEQSASTWEAVLSARLWMATHGLRMATTWKVVGSAYLPDSGIDGLL